MNKEPEIQQLTDWSHARLRTEMYFGSKELQTKNTLEYTSEGPKIVETTWVNSLFVAFREIVDNSLDEVISHGFGNRLEINYNPKTFVIQISDNGRGIPITVDEQSKLHQATIALTRTKAGRNFGDRGDSRGLNGLGAAITNFCSEYFDVKILRDKKEFTQRFHEGNGTNNDLIIEDPIIFPSDSKKTGTEITFKPSVKVFPKMVLPETFIKSRIVEIALCNPALKVFYNGTRIPSKGVEETLFSQHKPIIFNIDAEGFKSKFWLVPNFLENGDEYSYSLVNNIPVFDGGSHIDQFRRSFFSGLLSELEKESKKRKLIPNKNDIADGLLTYNITKMLSPTFDSQSKSRLINENVITIIKKTMDDAAFFKDVIKKNPDWIESIYEKCTLRTQKTNIADINKTVKKYKREKVEDLQDACSHDRSKCILFLTEGLSAISGLVSARDPDFHGGLAMKGKPMNVREKLLREVMDNIPLTSVMKSIGLFPNQRVNRYTLRYGRVYITTDADEDGKNIAALLINFFHFFWPELFDPTKPAFLSVFDTPLIIAVKGKQRKFWYKDDYAAFDANKYKGWEITRAKGLAALKKSDWQYVLSNPKLIPIMDDGKLADSLSLLFSGNRADDRKKWIGL